MEDFLDGANTSRKIKALLAARGLTAETLAPILNLHAVTIYARIKNNSWTVEEINKIAGHHDIDPKELI
jgi:hypothetical protein